MGLPIALEFARKMSVIGFDIRQDRVDLMKKSIDPSNELESSDFDGCDIEFTANLQDLKKANFHIVAVPTPINKHNLPESYFQTIMQPNGLLVDVKGIYRGKINLLQYWSL